VGDRY